MSNELQARDVLDILDAIPNRSTFYTQTEGDWFQMDFEADGTEYQLGVHIHRGIVSLYDRERGEEIYTTR
ncbi:hypothetical protein M1M18_gp035 [Halorubrum virus Serpecor1]|uniref:Uncharacterized protein n=1 Tax=Halorubrum virus Serpecor1 TaxID=2721757 RepID=A0A6G9RWK0_9CAUD|nr:hypothetical protein M1M18_gp035 [Halorubrum virus Serpecor1]QIR31265.1 hypothetical protein HrrSp1_520 [Halorubrum virus Serpecor1]